MNNENPLAGQGAVLLDIGGDVGALVVMMPPETEGLEVEIRPVAPVPLRGHHHHGGHPDHSHASPARHQHVAVVARRGKDGPAHTLVYPSVPEGIYDLVPIPGDVVALRAEVRGGQVTTSYWPA